MLGKAENSVQSGPLKKKKKEVLFFLHVYEDTLGRLSSLFTTRLPDLGRKVSIIK